jgi:hypothetical protein
MRLVKFTSTIGDVWINPEYVMSVETHKDDEDITIIFARPSAGQAISWHTRELKADVVANLTGARR